MSSYEGDCNIQFIGGLNSNSGVLARPWPARLPSMPTQVHLIAECHIISFLDFKLYITIVFKVSAGYISEILREEEYCSIAEFEQLAFSSSWCLGAMRGSVRAVLHGWRLIATESVNLSSIDTVGSTSIHAGRRQAHQWLRTNALAPCLVRFIEPLGGTSGSLEEPKNVLNSKVRKINSSTYDQRRFDSSSHGPQTEESSKGIDDAQGFVKSPGNQGSKATAVISDTRIAESRQEASHRQHISEKEGSDWDTVREMIKYVRPDGSVGVRRRVMAAAGLLLGSKLLNVQVPFLFKYTGALCVKFLLGLHWERKVLFEYVVMNDNNYVQWMPWQQIRVA